MSCGVGCRHSLDLLLLWLWRRLAAVAPIQPLVWEPPDAAGVTLKRKKKKKCDLKSLPLSPLKWIWGSRDDSGLADFHLRPHLFLTMALKKWILLFPFYR